MAIWQAMKGANENPKQEWICNDLRHQHFSEDTGRRLRKHVKKGDLLLIYFPGRVNRVYMGLQRAAEDGPRVLEPAVPGAVDWPWGLRVEGHQMDSGPTVGDQSPRIGNLFPEKTSNSSIWSGAGGSLGLQVLDPVAPR